VSERLRDEQAFTGGYTIVKDCIREHRRPGREMLVPLHHPPDHAQADFGEAAVVIGGVERTAHFFAFDLPHSDASFVRAYPAATAEAWPPLSADRFAIACRAPDESVRREGVRAEPGKPVRPSASVWPPARRACPSASSPRPPWFTS